MQVLKVPLSRVDVHPPEVLRRAAPALPKHLPAGAHPTAAWHQPAKQPAKEYPVPVAKLPALVVVLQPAAADLHPDAALRPAAVAAARVAVATALLPEVVVLPAEHHPAVVAAVLLLAEAVLPAAVALHPDAEALVEEVVKQQTGIISIERKDLWAVKRAGLLHLSRLGRSANGRHHAYANLYSAFIDIKKGRVHTRSNAFGLIGRT